MEPSGPESQPAVCLPWRGKAIGRLASTGIGLLWRTQWLVAILSAACLGFFLRSAWYPVLEKSSRALPDSFELQEGALRWPTVESRVLAENPFLSLSVELDPASPTSSTADLQLTFQDRSFKLSCLLGSTQFPYPGNLSIQSGRVLSTAWWGAWSWVALLGVCLASTLGLVIAWWILATLYWPASGFISFLFRKPSRLAQSWKLGAGALLFGASIMSLNVVLYSTLVIRAPGFIAGFVLHLASGWFGIPWGALHLPSAAKTTSRNPFDEPEIAIATPSPKRHDNPFKG